MQSACFTLLMIAVFAQSSFAQQNKAPASATHKKPDAPVVKNGKVVSTYQASGEVDPNDLVPKRTPVIPNAVDMSPLKSSSILITGKERSRQELNRLLSQPKKSPCENEATYVHIQDALFLQENDAQIQKILNQVTEGRRLQQSLIGGSSSLQRIRFRMKDSSGLDRDHEVRIGDLVAFIEKFEGEAAKISDEDAEGIAALIEKYSNPLNETNAEFYRLSLPVALRAFACPEGVTSGCLGSAIEREATARYRTRLFVGSGKNLFRVAGDTRLGFDPEFGNSVNTALNGTIKTGTTVSISQNFSEAMKPVNEAEVWKVIREQQLTIESHGENVPIDGFLRRQYFEAKRNLECPNEPRTVYKPDSTPGPFVPFEAGEPCKEQGIHVESSSLIVRGYDRNGTNGGTAHDFTEQMSVANGQSEFYSADGMASSTSAFGGWTSSDVTLIIRYRCGCGKSRSVEMHYKVGHGIKFGC